MGLKSLIFNEKDKEGFKPNCEIDPETLEVLCKPEWDMGDKVLKSPNPIRFKIVGKRKVQVVSTGDANEKLFNKTFDFVLNKSILDFLRNKTI